MNCLSFKEFVDKNGLKNVATTNITRAAYGVGLSLFPSDSLKPKSYEIIETAHIVLYYGVE